MADEYTGDPEGDPEARRVAELLRRVRSEQVTDAEREELALYVEERPELARRIEEEHQRRQLGGTWLARVEADQRLAAAESTPLVTAERGLGLVMTIGGFALMPMLPAVSLIGMIGGVGLLTWSFTRVRLKTYKHDPYRDIDK